MIKLRDVGASRRACLWTRWGLSNVRSWVFVRYICTTRAGAYFSDSCRRTPDSTGATRNCVPKMKVKRQHTKHTRRIFVHVNYSFLSRPQFFVLQIVPPQRYILNFTFSYSFFKFISETWMNENSIDQNKWRHFQILYWWDRKTEPNAKMESEIFRLNFKLIFFVLGSFSRDTFQ